MKKTVEEYIEYLYNCVFTDEKFDPEDNEVHLETSWEMLKNYSWEVIYPEVLKHLYNECKTSEEVINFANLFVYYGWAEKKVDDVFEFLGYLYYMVDVEHYWDTAGELFDGLAIQVLTNEGQVNLMKDPCYSPLKDRRILNSVAIWETRESDV